MPHIIIPSARRWQPRERAEVNWANPLTQGLCLLMQYVDGVYIDAVNGFVFTREGSQGLGYYFGDSAYGPVQCGAVYNESDATSGWRYTGPYGLFEGFSEGTTFAFIPWIGSNEVVENRFVSAWSTTWSTYEKLLSASAANVGICSRSRPYVTSPHNSRNITLVATLQNAVVTHWLNGVNNTSGSTSGVACTFSSNGSRHIMFGLNGTSHDPGCALALFGVTRRFWGDAEARAFHENPWQLFAPVRRVLYSDTPVPTIARPASDVARNRWTPVGRTQLYDCIDEEYARDEDFIESPFIDGAQNTVMTLTQSLSAGTHTVRVRARRDIGTASLRVHLLDGSNNIVGTSSWQSLTSNYAVYSLTVNTTGTASRIRIEVQ